MHSRPDGVEKLLLPFLILLGFSVAVVLSLAGWRLFESQRQAEGDALHHVGHLSVTLEGAVDHLYSLNSLIVRQILARLGPVRWDDPLFHAHAQSTLADMADDTSPFSSIALSDSLGNIHLVHGNPEDWPDSLAGMDIFQAQRDNPECGVIYARPPHLEAPLFVSQCIRDDQGRFSGVVALRTAPLFYDHIERLLDLTSLGQFGLSYVDGTEILRRPLSSAPLPLDLLSRGDSRPFREDGVGTFYAIRALSGFPLVAWVALDEQTALVHFHQQARQLAFVISALMVVVALVTLKLRAQVTRVAQAQNDLAENRAWLDEILNCVADGIFGSDARGRTVFINQAACRMIGWTPDEILGTEIHSKIHHTSEDGTPLPPEKCPTHQVLRSGKTITSDKAVFWHRSGRLFPVEMVCAPLLHDGEPVGSVTVFRDVTERQRQQREMEIKTRSLERSNADLQQFAYVVSHDLQEPLRMVSSYMELVRQRYEPLLDVEGREFVGYAVEGAQRMVGLVRGLLDYSRVGTQGQNLVPVDIGDVLTRALANLSLLIRESEARIDVGELPQVLGDANQLVSLFQNLLTNAIRYRDPERTPHIHVSARQEAGFWRFSLRDNGIGIEIEHRERIFKIFQRLHGHDGPPGLGVGLAICKRILERHDGAIWVESEPGKGSDFQFTLRAISPGAR
ncbi:hypothetical protein JCM17960_08840 [Magnetospira thiophila]